MYQIIDAMKIPADACRKIKGEPTTNSRNLKRIIGFRNKDIFLPTGGI
jgi:hypothetical protein